MIQSKPGRAEVDLARTAGFAVPVRAPARRIWTARLAGAWRRGRDAVLEQVEQRRRSLQILVPLGMCLIVVAAVIAGNLLRFDDSVVPMGSPPALPQKPRVKALTYNEEITAAGYINKDLGLVVPTPEGWVVEQAVRADLPGKQYEGTLVTLRQRSEVDEAPLISVARKTPPAAGVAVLQQIISSASGRRVLEEPKTRSLGACDWGRTLYESGQIVVQQFAVRRTDDVVMVTAIVPKGQFNKDLSGAIDAFVATIKLGDFN